MNFNFILQIEHKRYKSFFTDVLNQGILMFKLGVLIPYRERAEHLKILLEKLPKKIKDRNGVLIEHHLFVIEQGNTKVFNRGKLLNVGYSLIHQFYEYICFHDVDLIPLEADYSYPDRPTNLVSYASQFKQRQTPGLPYEEYFGGVLVFNKPDYEAINGFSNEYWGYGAEDDDLLFRVKEKGLKWTRRPGIFESLPHEYSGGGTSHYINALRLQDLKEGIEKDHSGLSDLEYRLIEKREFETHTHYVVDI